MPRGSMLKYFSDVGGDAEHGGKLHWPGTEEGFPFRGETVPNLKQQELEQLPLALDYKSRSFKLWDEQDKVAFDLVMDRVVNGWYMQHKRFDNYVAEHQDFVIRLEWVQIYGEDPRSKNPGSGVNEQTVNIPGAAPQNGLRQMQPAAGTRPGIQRQPGPIIGQQSGDMGTPGTPY